MNKIANRQVICDVLVEAAKEDKEIVALCSDSRGSASLTKFAETHPQQFIEVGIAEQNWSAFLQAWQNVGRSLMPHLRPVF